jgi:hypothetical protein
MNLEIYVGHVQLKGDQSRLRDLYHMLANKVVVGKRF